MGNTNNCCFRSDLKDKDFEVEKGRSIGIVDHDRSSNKKEFNGTPRKNEKDTPAQAYENKQDEMTKISHNREKQSTNNMATANTNVSKSTNLEEEQKIDSLRGGDFDMEAIEKEAADQAAAHEREQNSDQFGEQHNFGKLSTKELLAQSRQGLSPQLQLDIGHQNNESPERLSLMSATDEHQYIDQHDDSAQFHDQNQQYLQLHDDQNQQYLQPHDDQTQYFDEQQILDEFNHLYNTDHELKQMLGDFPDHYPIEEKLSIIDAYKNGGGVAGLANIIEEDDAQPVNHQYVEQQQHHELGDDDAVEIDLENPEDVKVIENEFRKLYDEIEDLRIQYGEALLNIDVIQKYQVIDAYHQAGYAGVQEILQVDDGQDSDFERGGDLQY